MLLRKLFFDAYGKPLSRQAVLDAVATLESLALFTGERRAVHLRVGEIPGGIAIDLGRDDGKAVHMIAGSWSIEISDVRFVRPPGFLELPLPEAGGSLDVLRDIFGLSLEAYHSFCAALLNAVRPSGPYFAVLISGPQGSGKSYICWVLKWLIDPNVASKQRLPENERDMMIHAKDHHLINYDNASGMRAAISDALCTLATGGGLTVRKLWTNDEAQVFSFYRPVVINGISGAAKRPDLLERMIPINLQGIGENLRRTEAEMEAEFLAARPKLLGALYHAAAAGLARLPHVETPKGIRMADAAKWLAACEEALGFEKGALVDTVRQGQDDLFIERITEDPLMIALQRVVRSKPFEGYVVELFEQLPEEHGRRDINLPKTPSHLSNALMRLAPAMRKAGMHVDDLGRDKRGRKVRVRADETFASVWGG